MGLKSSTPVAQPPVEAAPAASVGNTYVQKTSTSRDATVRGQVAMHSIIAGYRTAAILTPIIAGDPKGATEVLHALAHEIAKKIEEYAFHE